MSQIDSAIADATTAETAELGRIDRSRDRYRDTAKWLIGAYAAVGAILVAGLSLSSLGTLKDAKLWAAILGAALALLGVVVAVAAIAYVLTAGRVSLHYVVAPKTSPFGSHVMYKKLGELLHDSPDLLGTYSAEESEGRGKGVEALLADNSEPIKRVRELRAEYDASTSETEKETLVAAANREQERSKRAKEALPRLLAHLSLRSVEYRFNVALLTTVVSVIAIGAGMSTFAWAANQPKRADVPGVAVSESKGALVAVDLTKAGRSQLDEVLGAGCGTTPVGALVVDSPTNNALELVTLPRGSCAPYAFTLTKELGTIAESCPARLKETSTSTVKPAAFLTKKGPATTTTATTVSPFHLSPGTTVTCG